jgi:hypothetical protein
MEQTCARLMHNFGHWYGVVAESCFFSNYDLSDHWLGATTTRDRADHMCILVPFAPPPPPLPPMATIEATSPNMCSDEGLADLTEVECEAYATNLGLGFEVDGFGFSTGCTKGHHAGMTVRFGNSGVTTDPGTYRNAVCTADPNVLYLPPPSPPPASPPSPLPVPPPPSPPPAPPQGNVVARQLDSFMTPAGYTCVPALLLNFDNGDSAAPADKTLFIYDPFNNAGSANLDFCETLPFTAGTGGYTPVRLWGGTVPSAPGLGSLTLGRYADAGVENDYLTVRNVAGMDCIAFYADSASDANAAYAAVQHDRFLPLTSDGHQTRLTCTPPVIVPLPPPSPPPPRGEVVMRNLEQELDYFTNSAQACTDGREDGVLYFDNGINAPAYPLLYAYDSSENGGLTCMTAYPPGGGPPLWPLVALQSSTETPGANANVDAGDSIFGTVTDTNGNHYLTVLGCVAHYYSGATNVQTAHDAIKADWPVFSSETGQAFVAFCTTAPWPPSPPLPSPPLPSMPPPPPNTQEWFECGVYSDACGDISNGELIRQCDSEGVWVDAIRIERMLAPDETLDGDGGTWVMERVQVEGPNGIIVDGEEDYDRCLFYYGDVAADKYNDSPERGPHTCCDPDFSHPYMYGATGPYCLIYWAGTFSDPEVLPSLEIELKQRAQISFVNIMPSLLHQSLYDHACPHKISYRTTIDQTDPSGGRRLSEGEG